MTLKSRPCSPSASHQSTSVFGANHTLCARVARTIVRSLKRIVLSHRVTSDKRAAPLYSTLLEPSLDSVLRSTPAWAAASGLFARGSHDIWSVTWDGLAWMAYPATSRILKQLIVCGHAAKCVDRFNSNKMISLFITFLSIACTSSGSSSLHP